MSVKVFWSSLRKGRRPRVASATAKPRWLKEEQTPPHDDEFSRSLSARTSRPLVAQPSEPRRGLDLFALLLLESWRFAKRRATSASYDDK